MKKCILSFSLAFLCMFSLCACGEDKAQEEAVKSTPVEIALVEKGSISAENKVSGQVASGDTQSVFVALSVRCLDTYVEAGDTVTAGQTICTLDMASTWANYEVAVMSYENARTSYEDQSAVLSQQVAMAEKNVADTQALFELGAASQLEVENAKLQYENALAGMNNALSQLEIAMQNYQATIAQLESSLANIDRNGNVVSPISGTVQALNAAANAFVSPSAPVATIVSNTDMEINVSVSEALVAKLFEGGRVNVSISAVGREFQGTIDTVSRAVNPQTRLYGVTIKVPSSQASGLLTGMFADVTFYTDSQDNVVLVPTEAIQTGTSGQHVFILDEQDIAHMIPVQTGLVGDGITEITSGLSGGERLVTVGQFYLKDGSQVRVVSAEV